MSARRSSVLLLFLGFAACNRTPPHPPAPAPAVAGTPTQKKFALSPEDCVQQGKIVLERRKYDQAIAFFNQAVEQKPDYGDAYANRARAYLGKRDADRAMADVRQALKLDKKADYYVVRGHARIVLGNYDLAIEDATTALSLAPNWERALFLRGFAQERQKNWERAISDYKATVTFDPEYALAHDHLAWVLATCPNAELRDGRTALRHAHQACKLADYEYSLFLDALAAACAETGNFAEAVKWARKAVELAEYQELADDIARRLRLYERRQPFRMPD